MGNMERQEEQSNQLEKSLRAYNVTPVAWGPSLTAEQYDVIANKAGVLMRRGFEYILNQKRKLRRKGGD